MDLNGLYNYNNTNNSKWHIFSGYISLADTKKNTMFVHIHVIKKEGFVQTCDNVVQQRE
jgi:hypothetical protein